MPNNQERAAVVRGALCKPDADDYSICVLRSALIDAFKDTNIPVSAVCRAYAPLNRERKITKANIDSIDDIADQVSKSRDPDLKDIGDVCRMVLI
ncbi:hypothetical protein [Pseudomonas yamanorum]|uniref:hypothetical protein n=1 Tax=Pseudomonas yamanorum TaxID=515393 RepID=UPI003B9EDD6F